MNQRSAQESIPGYKASDIKRVIDSSRKTGVALMLWGPPGVGKSETVAEYAKENDLELIDYRAVLVDPVDLRGIPCVVEGENGIRHTVWCVPDEFPKDGKGILFIDEINAAPQSVQAAFYQLTHGRKIGQYELPEGWYVMAAGNRETDRAVVNRMPSALSNRFQHAEFLADLNVWVDWAIKKGLEPEVIAFLRYRPELLNKLDPDFKCNPTPRTWERASELIAVAPEDLLCRMISGTVGEAAGMEFWGFKKIVNSLPSISGIMSDPMGSDIPQDPAVLYALTGALARNADQSNISDLYAYLKRLPKEFLIVTMRDAIRWTPEIQETATFVEFATNNQHVLVN